MGWQDSWESAVLLLAGFDRRAATWLMQRGVPIWQAAGYLGMSAEMLDRVYGHHSPDRLKGAAHAITGKNKANVSVVVSVVDETQARAKLKKVL
jgi:hypothetical protein